MHDFDRILKNKGILIKYNDSLAKTEGISLYIHTLNVYKEFLNIYNSRKRTFFKYLETNNSKNSEIIISEFLEIIIYHDFGKLYKRWQEFCKNNKLIKVKFRHELGFLPEIVKRKQDFFDNIEIIVAILSHHNNLSYNLNKIEKFNSYGEDIKLIDTDIFENIKNICPDLSLSNLLQYKIYNNQYISEKINHNIIFWYNIMIKRHYLQLADKRASIKEQNTELNDFEYLKENEIFYDFKYEKRNIQKITANNSDLILILRGPTGSGKTSAAEIWANNQFKLNKCERLIFSMPTQFTSNALAKSISEDTSLFLNDVKIQHGQNKLNNKSFIEKLYNNTFEYPVNVCTIDQILYAFNLGKESHKSAAFNIANSCVVIDECDFYDDFVLANIIELLKILYKLKVPVLLMSATLPDSFVNLINKELNLNLSIKDDTSDLERNRISINNILNEEKQIEETILKCKNKEQVIIYANTVKNAIRYYRLLLKHCPERCDEIIIYHSKFLFRDKSNKEKRILELLGKDGIGKGIIIMTQIGELSINISSNYIITEIAPFDRLVQRFGRGCRFDKNICDIDIIIPKDKNNNDYFAPYGEYDLKAKKWVPNEFIEKTLNFIEIKKYSGQDYLNIINIIYDDFKFSQKAIDNSKKLTNNFIINTIFNANYNIDEMNLENDESEWKSRNILQQYKLFIGEPQNTKNRFDFDKMKNENALDISKFELMQYDKLGIINRKELIIDIDTSENIMWISDIHYNGNRVGLEIQHDKINNNYEII